MNRTGSLSDFYKVFRGKYEHIQSLLYANDNPIGEKSVLLDWLEEAFIVKYLSNLRDVLNEL